MIRPLIGLLLAASLGSGLEQTPLQQSPGGRGAPAGRGALNNDPEEIRLWEQAAPGALGDADTDTPTLTVYRAARGATGTAVVVAPGGGYGGLAMDHEGRQVASWFNAMGVTAFVLKYRLGPRYHHPIELGDGQRAIRVARRSSE
jgi:acetyl esterase/lipase